jgi:hypothetical protein
MLCIQMLPWHASMYCFKSLSWKNNNNNHKSQYPHSPAYKMLCEKTLKVWLCRKSFLKICRINILFLITVSNRTMEKSTAVQLLFTADFSVMYESLNDSGGNTPSSASHTTVSCVIEFVMFGCCIKIVVYKVGYRSIWHTYNTRITNNTVRPVSISSC